MAVSSTCHFPSTYYCQPCSMLEEYSVGTNWCVECELCLCSRCSKLHKAIPSLKSHTILDRNVFLKSNHKAIPSLKSHTILDRNVFLKSNQGQATLAHHISKNLKTLTITKKVTVKFPDISLGNITSMAYSTCDKLLLSDFRLEGKILLCDSDVNVIKPLETTGHFPWDVTIIPKTSIAVIRFVSQHLEFVDLNVGKSSSFTGPSDGEVSSVWATDQKVFEFQSSQIKCCDLKGNPLYTIDLQNITTNDFESYIHVHQNGNMYTGSDRQVFCVKMDGTTLFKYSPTNLKSAKKITSDENGVVYVVDEYSNNVHRLTEDGRFIDTILDGKLTSPKAICFSKDFNRCYISGDLGKCVYICDCS